MVGGREYPSAPIVGVGAVVIDGDRVLLGQRGREPLLGQWSIPGGAVELGETLEEAIVREVAEETCLTIEPVAILKTFDRIERDAAGSIRFHYVLVDFLCRLVEKPEALRAASDVSDVRWVALDGLRQSEEFILPEWTLDVVEEAWRQVRAQV